MYLPFLNRKKPSVSQVAQPSGHPNPQIDKEKRHDGFRLLRVLGILILTGIGGYFLWFIVFRRFWMTPSFMSVYWNLQYSPVYRIKIGIGFLMTFFIISVLYGFRRLWIPSIRNMWSLIGKGGQILIIRITTWRMRFLTSSPPQQFKMIRIPFILLILSVGLFLFGKYVIPPTVVSVFPDNESRDTPLTTRVEFIFSRNVIRKSAEFGFRITPSVEGTFEWESGQKLIFVPKTALARGIRYSAGFKTPVLGMNLMPVLFKTTTVFETLGDPKVVLNSPQTEALEDYAPITVVFDRPMIPLTTATNSALKQPAFTVEPAIRGEGRWLGTTAYQYRPSERFHRSSTYTVTVPAGIRSQDGGVLKSPHNWSFSSERPRVLYTSPTENYSYASPEASVAAFFNQVMNKTSAESAFALYDSKNIRIPGKITIEQYGVGFHPASPLKREERYRATIAAGLLSSEGPNGLESPYEWFFTVAPLPAIMKTDPADSKKDVSENNYIRIDFRSPMDEESFKENYAISPVPDTKATYYFSSYRNEHRLSIGTYLGRSKTYTVTISGNVKDQYGVPLGKPYTFSFTTAPYKPSVSIFPNGTYFGAFNQTVVPRLIVEVTNSKKVDYSLYRLKKTEFFELYDRRYGEWCRIHKPNDRSDACYRWRDFDTSRLDKVRTWSESFEVEGDTPVQVVTKVSGNDGENIPSGLYYIEAKIGTGEFDSMVMVVTKSALTVKQSQKEIFAWAVNQTNGEVVPSMNVSIITPAGTVLAQGKTNNDGVWKEKVDYNKSGNLLVYGETGDDITVAATAWSEGINRYDFGLPSYYDSNQYAKYDTEEIFKQYVVLDRPLYRPGQKVYFKGVIRKDTDGAYETVPAGDLIHISINDARNRPIYSSDLPLSTFGSYAGEIILGTDANLGSYTLKAEYKGNYYSLRFDVEEYKKPEHMVSVSPSKQSYSHGEKGQFTIAASYYFGAPVSDAPVSWTLAAQDYAFRWDRDTRFEFGDAESYWDYWWGEEYDTAGATVTSGKGITDGKGEYAVTVSMDISKYKTSQKMVMEAVVNDLNNQSIAASGEVVVHKSDLYVGLHPARYSNDPGKEAEIELVTLDKNGKEAKNIPVTAELYKRKWDTVREQDPDTGTYNYVTKSVDTLLDTKTVVTGDLARGIVAFTPPDGGTYRVVAKVTDENGRTNVSSTFLWVWGYGFSSPRQNNDRIILVSDKKDYVVGETASLFVATPFASQSAMTLLTVERSNVIDYKIVRTGNDSNNFPITVADTYTPNVFLGAVLVKPGDQVKNPPEFKIGYTEIKVSDPAKKIDVTITTDKSRYKPKETLTATIQTKNAGGSPVSAEVAVGLVDTAVLDLSMAQMPEIYKTFYQPRNLDISTAQLLTISMDRINANTDLGAKGGSGGGCFTGDTPILMDGGTSKPIRDITVGDKVLTRLSETNPDLVAATVTGVDKHSVDQYLIINGILEITPVHVVYANRGWVVAGALSVGDRLIDANDNPWPIRSIERVTRKTEVYNLNITGKHTFIAGGVYVHNEKGGFDTTRRDFPDTAYWKPNLTTDTKGRLSIPIQLPDSLTTWRLSAIANSDKNAFGSETTDVIVSRDILIRPFMPRFLAAGDQAWVGGIIANTSGSDRTVTVNLEATGVSILEVPGRTFTLPDGSQKKLLWKVEAGSEGKITVKINARDETGSMKDAVETSIPIVSYSVAETVATSGVVTGTSRETISLPSDVDMKQGYAKISLSAFLGLGVIPSIRNLMEYPYFCAEQTTSKLLPAVYLQKIMKLAGVDEIAGTGLGQLDFLVTDAIQRLYSMQHPDGGWGWWLDSKSDRYLTAYALLGLMEAKEYGFTVDEATLDRAIGYLSVSLAGMQNHVSDLDDTDAFILYVLRNSKISQLRSYAALLYDRRFTLTLEGRSHLVMAMAAQGSMDEMVKRLRNEIVSLAKKTATTVHWEEKDRDYSFLGSNTTTTAAILEMIVSNDKENPLIPEILRYLSNHRKGDRWYSTKDTAAVLRTVAKLLILKKDYALNASYKVSLDNTVLTDGTLTKKDLFSLVEQTIDVKDLTPGTNRTLEFAKSGTGNLYYNINLKYFLPFSTIQPLEQGFVMMREYVDDKNNTVSPNEMSENSERWVRLTVVAPEERNYVIVEDMLPAGLEVVNDSLKTVRKLGVQKPNNKTDHSSWYFSHVEYHDDKVALFAQYLPAGVYEFLYRVRSTVPGRFHHPPAQVYQMYTPDVSGHSEGGWLTVTERN